MVHGADVASKEIVVFNGERTLSFPNTEPGIGRFLKGILPSSILALEPTSHYSDRLAQMAYEAGHTVYVVQPSWIRSQRRAKRHRAKTDKVDAAEIRNYVIQEMAELHPWRPLANHLEELRNLVRQRQGIADDLARMNQRYKGLQLNTAYIEAITLGLKQAKKDFTKKIKIALRQIPEARVVLQIPGIGVHIAATAIVALQHIPFATADAFVAYIGLDPVAADSGQKESPRRISKRGDVALRRAFFLAAMTASTHQVWKERYQNLKDKGLQPRQALIALAKKIAVTAFHIHRLQVDFDPGKVQLKGP